MAAAEAAESDGLPPEELRYAWMCREFPGTLPNAGGLRDQPVQLMTRMRATYNIWSAMKEFIDHGLSPEWTTKNHDKYELVVAVMKLKDELASEKEVNAANE